ncbi:Ca2+-binding RTX toxin-like protein [Sinorhizobium fredii]|uniref:calcium-binding protein n=1 Tax=Rhizobium fredii TaxID=380 RepID=UPI0035120393
MSGGDGDDKISLGGGGADQADGGTGNDQVIVDRSSLTTAQAFSVSGSTAMLSDGTRLTDFEHYRVLFGSGDDVVISVGSAEGVQFYGNGGNDTLIGGSGVDVLDGGAGNDMLTAGAGNDIINDFDGWNTIDAGDGNDGVNVGDGSSGASNNTVDLGAGDDTFRRGASTGSLVVDGGSGIDYAAIDFSKYAAGITFKLSSDVTAANAPVTVRNVERVSLVGGAGNDLFAGGSLNDELSGGAGNDHLNGGAGDDEISGGVGNDTLRGGAGNDVIRGANYSATEGRDVIYAEDGNDTVHIGIGDKADGGAGTDTLNLNLAQQTQDFNVAFSDAAVIVDTATWFSGFEVLGYQGSQGRDRVTGGDLGDELAGNAGDDVLKGGSGDDTLEDGTGDDQLFGDAGNDLLRRDDTAGKDVFDGGAGVDTLSFEDGSTSVVLDLQDQASNKGLALGLTIRNVETIEGSGYDDEIRGDANGNILYGRDADDILDGRGGNDTLVGGSGDDWLTGGAGSDRFVFDEDGLDGEGDVITDFVRGQDKLVIERAGFGIAAGDTAVTLVTGTEPEATSRKGTFLFETDNGRLWFDADGSGTGEDPQLVAILQNVTTLSTGDFSLF